MSALSLPAPGPEKILDSPDTIAELVAQSQPLLADRQADTPPACKKQRGAEEEEVVEVLNKQ